MSADQLDQIRPKAPTGSRPPPTNPLSHAAADLAACGRCLTSHPTAYSPNEEATERESSADSLGGRSVDIPSASLDVVGFKRGGAWAGKQADAGDDAYWGGSQSGQLWLIICAP